jgi:hypothetical protein
VQAALKIMGSDQSTCFDGHRRAIGAQREITPRDHQKTTRSTEARVIAVIANMHE